VVVPIEGKNRWTDHPGLMNKVIALTNGARFEAQGMAIMSAQYMPLP